MQTPLSSRRLAALLLAIACSLGAAAAAQSVNRAKSRTITKHLRAIVAKKKITGIVAAIANGRRILAIGAAGVRKRGAKTPFTPDDQVHLGSCTKAMTCVLLSTLVKEGKLAWDTTLIEGLPELKGKIHAAYHDVTLWQLVTHRAGFPANARNWWRHRDRPIRKRRMTLLEENLAAKPKTPVGEYLYSNLAYMAAGCMAERVTGASWESLMKTRLFTPLGMTSAGFGAPGTPKQIDQPWGHIKKAGKWQPHQFDNAAALGPAGTVRCTVADWAKFVALQLPASPARASFDRAALKKLIVPTKGNYAGGWVAFQRKWAKGLTLTHNGSNTCWYATVWVAPRLNRAYFVAMNCCEKQSNAINDSVTERLIRLDRTGR